MNDLATMLASMPLREVEAEIKNNIAAMAISPDTDVKAAVILSMLAGEAMEALDRIDASGFPAKLRAELDAARERYDSRRAAMHEHRTENRRVLDAIGPDGELPALDAQVEQLLTRYDSMLAARVGERDSKLVGEL